MFHIAILHNYLIIMGLIIYSTATQTLNNVITSMWNSDSRLDEIISITNCVHNISSKYAGGRNLIFMSDQIDTDISEYLVKNLNPGLKIISSLSNVAQNIGLFLLFQDKRESSYVEILEKIPSNDRMRFVVIFDFQDRIDLRQIQKVLEEFWMYYIIDVITIVPYRISKNIRIYTYYPYSPTRCGETGPPILINVWNSQNKVFLNKNSLFSRSRKVFNLHGCPLKCVGIHRPPESTIIHNALDNTWKLSGTANKAFKFIEKYMNFTTSISLFQKSDREQNSKVNISKSKQSPIQFDIAFGKFIRILDAEPNADFTTENVMDCFTWGVPHGIGRQPSIWTKYTIEFSAPTWAILLIFIFITSIIIRLMVSRLHLKHKDWLHYHYILFYTFSTFIGATLKLKSRRTMLRLFVGQWLLCSLVITAAYTAFMGSLLTIPRTEPEINKQSDLLNTTLNLVGRQEMFHVLNESAATHEEFRNIIERFFILPPINFDDIINRMIEQRDIAVFTSKRELIYYAQKRRDDLSKKNEIHIFTDCVIKSYSSAFMLNKGSPFKHPIHKIISKLYETGIYNYWDKENIRDEIFHNIIFTKETILVLNELYGAFAVLMGGVSIATIAFFIELFVKMVQDRRYQKLIRI